jgi:hypothetical protein
MEITIEQVEKLMERADISYEEAKAALEAANGDILEAIIALEKTGKTAKHTGSYSTNGVPMGEDAAGGGQTDGRGGEQNGHYRRNGDYAYKDETSGFAEVMGRIWRFTLRVLHKANINHFEIYRRGESILSVPVTVLILALVFFFWIVLPILIIALFFGCKYRFKGPDLGRDDINKAMNAAANTAEELKQSVRDAANNGGEPH